MRGIANYFSVSKEFKDVSEINFEQDSLLFYGLTHEERSELSNDVKTKHPNIAIVFIDELENQRIKLKIGDNDLILSLRSFADSSSLADKLEGRPIYIDITGLQHSSWAWLVRVMMQRKSGKLWALYSEPIEYKFHDAPLDGQMFDLSEKISGIAPLPSFARLAHYRNNNFVFMPLLGFEGARLSHIMEDVQPSRELTFPVIGVPGFRYDFPFYTYQGNRLALEREGIWKNWRYEKANCPVSVYMLGLELLKEYNDLFLRIAPIGTKPHSLGAVLLKLSHPTKVDLIYDHPIRKKGRTKGKSKTLCYWLSPFKEVITL
jgi:hypothetical protein